MKKPVPSTYKILKEKAFNSDVNESWIDWAIEMMEVGYESVNLYELAGTTRPYNQFELQELTNKVFKELNLDYSDKTNALKNYIYFLLTTSIDKPENYNRVLQEFRDIYYELDADPEYQDLALLYWAKDDLIYSEFQHYWDGADRTNIDQIIREQFGLYIAKFEDQK
ncbi:MAG TPA: hypothetical protein PLP23_08845 [Panacibacter sp.]|nr:hypothetical protein [Panacibacter sp.]